MAHPLDCPAWSALTSRQAALSIGGERARRFREDIGPFAAARDASPEAVAALAKVGGQVVSTGGKPLVIPAGQGQIKVAIVRDPDNLFLVLIGPAPAQAAAVR